VLDASLHRTYCGPLGRRTALCQWASRPYRCFGWRDAGLRWLARRRRGNL